MTPDRPADAPIPAPPSDPAARAAWARGLTRVPYLPHAVLREDRADGTILLRSPHPLGRVARCTGEWLHRWAQEAPERIALSERAADGGWRDLSYAQLLAQVRALAAGLLARGMGPADRIAILSGNSIEHRILSLAAQYVGIPVTPLAEQYSLVPEAYGRLQQVIGRLKPTLVFADNGTRYARGLCCAELRDLPAMTARGDAGRAVIALSDLLDTEAGAEVDAAHAQVGPQTLAKILFTSGSSSEPKGVLTTQAMMCVNQAQMAVVLPFLSRQPPQITDWLPWNHVFGGSHNANMALAHGGTLTIDNGKPTAGGIAATLANRSDRPGTLFFNVPVGFSMITDAAGHDPALRQRLFESLEMIFYAGASLPQSVWEALEQFSLQSQGALPMMISSWGLTETAPACLMVHEPIGRSGVIGVPLPGIEAKLIPDDDMRCEIRVRGPNVTAGYLDEPEKTAAAFDDEGFFITGDAVRFLDPTDPARGLVFDGRVSEDFKLETGTWVQAGNLRMAALRHLAGLAQDVVICGHDRGEIGLFVFPQAGLAADGAVSDGAISDQALLARIETQLRAMNEGVSGSAKRITRALVLAEPPSVGAHEITDKGSLNVKRILTNRAALLERLYDNEDPALVRV
ncbi:MAG: hypothetical protein RLZ26_1840 [Pseudomonadota bacterium]|jgi:feruloyl-CoA synthase